MVKPRKVCFEFTGVGGRQSSMQMEIRVSQVTIFVPKWLRQSRLLLGLNTDVSTGYFVVAVHALLSSTFTLLLRYKHGSRLEHDCLPNLTAM